MHADLRRAQGYARRSHRKCNSVKVKVISYKITEGVVEGEDVQRKSNSTKRRANCGQDLDLLVTSDSYLENTRQKQNQLTIQSVAFS